MEVVEVHRDYEAEDRAYRERVAAWKEREKIVPVVQVAEIPQKNRFLRLAGLRFWWTVSLPPGFHAVWGYRGKAPDFRAERVGLARSREGAERAADKAVRMLKARPRSDFYRSSDE